MTFTVGPTTTDSANETLPLVGSDSNETPAAEIVLSKDMEPTTYTVDLGKCDRLVFYLRNSEEMNEWTSCKYGFYNITLSK